MRIPYTATDHTRSRIKSFLDRTRSTYILILWLQADLFLAGYLDFPRLSPKRRYHTNNNFVCNHSTYIGLSMEPTSNNTTKGVGDIEPSCCLVFTRLRVGIQAIGEDICISLGRRARKNWREKPPINRCAELVHFLVALPLTQYCSSTSRPFRWFS